MTHKTNMTNRKSLITHSVISYYISLITYSVQTAGQQAANTGRHGCAGCQQCGAPNLCCLLKPGATLPQMRGCRAVHYCSPTCQMNHWTWHRDHCKPNKRAKYEEEDAQRQLPLSRDASGNGEPSVASADGHYPVRAVVLPPCTATGTDPIATVIPKR